MIDIKKIKFEEHDLYNYLEANHVDVFMMLRDKHRKFDKQNEKKAPNLGKTQTILAVIDKHLKGVIFTPQHVYEKINLPGTKGALGLAKNRVSELLRFLADIGVIDEMQADTSLRKYFSYGMKDTEEEFDDTDDVNWMKKLIELKLVYYYKLIKIKPETSILINYYAKAYLEDDNFNFVDVIKHQGKIISDSFVAPSQEAIWLSKEWCHYSDQQNGKIIPEESEKDKNKPLSKVGVVFFGEKTGANTIHAMKNRSKKQLLISGLLIKENNFDYDIVGELLNYITINLDNFAYHIKW